MLKTALNYHSLFSFFLSDFRSLRGRGVVYNIGKITDLCTFYAPTSDLCSELQIYVWLAVLCCAKLVRFGKLSLSEYFADLCIARIYLHIYVSILHNYVRSRYSTWIKCHFCHEELTLACDEICIKQCFMDRTQGEWGNILDTDKTTAFVRMGPGM